VGSVFEATPTDFFPPPLPSPVVRRVKGEPVEATAGQHAGPLKGRLCRVVAGLTEALKVGRVMEQHGVAFVWCLVIDNVRGRVLANGKAVHTPGARVQLSEAQFAPRLGVVEVVPIGLGHCLTLDVFEVGEVLLRDPVATLTPVHPAPGTYS